MPGAVSEPTGFEQLFVLNLATKSSENGRISFRIINFEKMNPVLDRSDNGNQSMRCRL
jgi:hypothetical protein